MRHLIKAVVAAVWSTPSLVWCADSYGVLPDVFSTQLHSEAQVNVVDINHSCPVYEQCFEQRSNTYLRDVSRSAATADLASAFDPALLQNTGTSRASMGFGWMAGSASGAVSSVPPPGSVAVHAQANSTSKSSFAFADLLTIGAAGLQGRHGLAHARVTMVSNGTGTTGGPNLGAAGRDGTTGAADLWLNSYDWIPPRADATAGWLHGRGAALASVNSRYGSNLAATSEVSVFDPHSNQYLRYYFGIALPEVTLDIVIPFVFGKLFGLEGYGDVESLAGVSRPALSPFDANYHFPRSATASTTFAMGWGGIQSVELDSTYPTLYPIAARATGAAPIEFSVTSISGADYSQAISAVPEPAAWLMFWAGGALVVLLRRGCPLPRKCAFGIGDAESEEAKQAKGQAVDLQPASASATR